MSASDDERFFLQKATPVPYGTGSLDYSDNQNFPKGSDYRELIFLTGEILGDGLLFCRFIFLFVFALLIGA